MANADPNYLQSSGQDHNDSCKKNRCLFGSDRTSQADAAKQRIECLGDPLLVSARILEGDKEQDDWEEVEEEFHARVISGEID